MQLDDLYRIHAPAHCDGHPCCIHSPSSHPLNHAPLNWRGFIMERICEHGIGHPDPDDLAWRERTGRQANATHGCDGCCQSKSAHRRLSA